MLRTTTHLQDHSCVYNTFDRPFSRHLAHDLINILLNRGIASENLNPSAGFSDGFDQLFETLVVGR